MRRLMSWLVLVVVALTVAGCTCGNPRARCEPSCNPCPPPCPPSCPPPCLPPCPPPGPACACWPDCIDCYGHSGRWYLHQIALCATSRANQPSPDPRWAVLASAALKCELNGLDHSHTAPTCTCEELLASVRNVWLAACAPSGVPADPQYCIDELNHCDPSGHRLTGQKAPKPPR